MRRFQKAFFALAVVIALGWIGPSIASAVGVTFFVSATSPRKLRPEGLAEATGAIAFAANSSGSIVVGTIFELDYGAPIMVDSGTVEMGCAAGGFDQDYDGNVLTLTVTTQLDCTAGEAFSISGVRVSANALGAGANVTVSVSATVPAGFQATNPATLVIFTALTVGSVQVKSSTTTMTPSNGGSFLFCNVQANLTEVLVKFTITESFASAFLSEDDEDGLDDNVDTRPMRYRFSFTGIPAGVAIDDAVDFTDTSATVIGLLSHDLDDDFVATASTRDVDVDVFIGDEGGNTDTNAIETMVVTFRFFVPDLTKLSATEAIGSVKVALRGETDITRAPRFASNTQLSTAVIRTLACASYLLFPWVANTADGAYDTGFAISNTTADPPAIGTPAQKGKVTMYFFRSSGTNPAPVVMNGGADLEAGRTTTGVLSNMVSGQFLGYAIAVCTFQMGHGFVFINSPSPGTGGAFAQGYLGISLTNPRIHEDDVTEAAGH